MKMLNIIIKDNCDNSFEFDNGNILIPHDFYDTLSGKDKVYLFKSLSEDDYRVLSGDEIYELFSLINNLKLKNNDISYIETFLKAMDIRDDLSLVTINVLSSIINFYNNSGIGDENVKTYFKSMLDYIIHDHFKDLVRDINLGKVDIDPILLENLSLELKHQSLIDRIDTILTILPMYDVDDSSYTISLNGELFSNITKETLTNVIIDILNDYYLELECVID